MPPTRAALTPSLIAIVGFLTLCPVVMLVIGTASIFSWLLASEEIPKAVTESILGLTQSRLLILLLVNVLLLVIGTFMETTASLIILTPILLPLMVKVGVDPLHFGVIIVLNLVIGFVRPTGGRILLDGRDMKEIDLRAYRRFISVVPQESILFEGSVRENVTYGLNEVPDNVVESALRDANAWEFVQALPEGVETHIGERGARLSGGQRQRLAIARALIRNPRVLILDEATSALDSDTERHLHQALGAFLAGRTTLIIAHRLSAVRQADRILVFENGRVVEEGAHDELIQRGGLYQKLYQHP